MDHYYRHSDRRHVGILCRGAKYNLERVREREGFRAVFFNRQYHQPARIDY